RIGDGRAGTAAGQARVELRLRRFGAAADQRGGDLGRGHAVQAQQLAAGTDRGHDLFGAGRGEQQQRLLVRLLERLQERVGRFLRTLHTSQAYDTRGLTGRVVLRRKTRYRKVSATLDKIALFCYSARATMQYPKSCRTVL